MAWGKGKGLSRTEINRTGASNIGIPQVLSFDFIRKILEIDNKLIIFHRAQRKDQICAERKGGKEAHICIFYLIFKDDLFDQNHMV